MNISQSKNSRDDERIKILKHLYKWITWILHCEHRQLFTMVKSEEMSEMRLLFTVDWVRVVSELR